MIELERHAINEEREIPWRDQAPCDEPCVRCYLERMRDAFLNEPIRPSVPILVLHPRDYEQLTGKKVEQPNSDMLDAISFAFNVPRHVIGP